MKSGAVGFLVVAILMTAAAAGADWLGSQAGKNNVPVCIGFSFSGKPTTAEEHSFTAPVDMLFPANLGAAKGFTTACKFKTAATADAAFLLTDNGATKATLTVSASGTNCSLSTQSAFTVATGHRLGITAPTQDATLADGSITVCATR